MDKKTKSQEVPVRSEHDRAVLKHESHIEATPCNKEEASDVPAEEVQLEINNDSERTRKGLIDETGEHDC